MPRSVVTPITNVYARGDYTAQVFIGSDRQLANLILDSGSSAMVVETEDYTAEKDVELVATRYAQIVAYGQGGWCGPVVKTRVEMGRGAFQVGLADAHIAVAKREQSGTFGEADGMLGLAYRELNRARDLTSYLQENQIDPPLTFPWYLNQAQEDDSMAELRRFLGRYPRAEIEPYFTQLERTGVVGNQFAFIIHRSSIYQTHRQRTTAELARHPLNNGLLVMGHPKFHESLYRGDFHALKVVHDKYYNVHLTHMQVGDRSPVVAPELAAKHVKGYVTNAIIDSGASTIVLPASLFDQLFSDLIAINAEFESILEPFRIFDGTEKGIPMEQVRLSEWPDLHFTFDGFDGAGVTLTMTPETYWQTHAPCPNQASFQFVHLPGWPNQAIMGLPLMNNYFTIFDRAERQQGAVLFAEKTFEPHRLGEAVHRRMDELKGLFQHNGLI